MLLHIRLFFCCALLSFMSPAAYAETFRAQDSSFIIDLPAGWQTQNTAGENGLLFKAERGGRDIAVSTLEQEFLLSRWGTNLDGVWPFYVIFSGRCSVPEKIKVSQWFRCLFAANDKTGAPCISSRRLIRRSQNA